MVARLLRKSRALDILAVIADKNYASSFCISYSGSIGVYSPSLFIFDQVASIYCTLSRKKVETDNTTHACSYILAQWAEPVMLLREPAPRMHEDARHFDRVDICIGPIFVHVHRGAFELVRAAHPFRRQRALRH